MYPVAPRPEQRRDRGAAGPEADQAPEAAAAAPGCRGVWPAAGTGNSGDRHQQPPCASHPTESGPRPASLAPEAAPIWRVRSRSRHQSGTGRSGGAPSLRRRTSARCCDPRQPDKAERSPGHTQPRPSAMSPTRTIAPRVEGGAARGAWVRRVIKWDCCGAQEADQDSRYQPTGGRRTPGNGPSLSRDDHICADCGEDLGARSGHAMIESGSPERRPRSADTALTCNVSSRPVSRGWYQRTP